MADTPTEVAGDAAAAQAIADAVTDEARTARQTERAEESVVGRDVEADEYAEDSARREDEATAEIDAEIADAEPGAEVDAEFEAQTQDEAEDSDEDDDEDDEADEDDGDAEGQPEAASSGRPSKRARRVADLEREGEIAADYLETLLDIADLDGDLEVDVEGDRASVSIVDSEEGRVPRRLVGSDGEVLEALQELSRLAVQKATGDRSRLMLDVAGHRAARKQALMERVRTAIEKVRAEGVAVEMDPMNAFERKVIHDEVLAAGLVSESEGQDPYRYVVISGR